MEKWMSKISDNKKLEVINIPGTHDSAACHMNRMSFGWAKTQDLNIADQLKIGIRLLDIRIVQGNNNILEDEDIICCHGICDCYVSPNFGDNRKVTYKSILLDVKNFLEENPSETVLIGTYLGRGKNYDSLTRAYEIFNKYVGNISINYRPGLTFGETRGKVINYTRLDEEFDKINNLRKITSKTILSSTGINDVHRRYQNCATFKTNGNIKVREMRDMFNIYKMT
jgi:1-phosphatidylinositol phosphodiesterase